MRTLSAACLLLLGVFTVARACDPLPYIPDKLLRDEVLKDLRFAVISDESEWRTLQDQASPLDEWPPGRCLTSDSDVDIASLAGAPATRVRVTAIRASSGLPNADEWSDAVDTVLKVWAGKFRSAGLFIGWSEGSLWSVSATIDYANGSTGSLLTDGVHVKLQDTLGRYWYLRLLPAGQ